MLYGTVLNRGVLLSRMEKVSIHRKLRYDNRFERSMMISKHFLQVVAPPISFSWQIDLLQLSTMINAKRERMSMLLSTIPLGLLLLLLVSCGAFCTIPSQQSPQLDSVGRCSTQTTPRAVVSSLSPTCLMAMPGMSEEQRKLERDNEIRQKIAKVSWKVMTWQDEDYLYLKKNSAECISQLRKICVDTKNDNDTQKS